MKRMLPISKGVIFSIALISVYFMTFFMEISFDPEFSVKPKIDVDYEYEQFFPEEDDDLRFFSDYRDKFESDNDFLLIGLKNVKGVFQREFVLKMDSLTKDLSKLDFVTSVHSPTNITYHKISSLGTTSEVNYVSLDNDLVKDSLNVYSHTGLINSLFSEDGKSVAILVKTEENLPIKKSKPLLASLELLKTKYSFDEIHMSGKIIAQSYYMHKMGSEMGIFMLLSTILLVFFLWVTFRSWWGVVIPIVVVLLSILWTMAFMHLSGKSFDMLTVLMPTIIFVVGMSDVIHILSKYLEELRKGFPKMEALKIAFKEVGIATFLTSLTTAIGFYTLLIATVVPVQDFGWYTGAGVFISYLLAFTLFPSVLLNVKEPKITKEKKKNLFWTRKLHSLFLNVIKFRKGILICSVLVMISAIIMSSMIQIENFLLEDLNNEDPVKQDVSFFEKEFSGIRPFELSLSLSGKESVWSESSIKGLHKLETYLIESYGVGAIISPLSVVKLVNQTLRGGRARFYRFPKSDKQLEKVLEYVRKFEKKEEIQSYMKLFLANDGTIRVSGKIPDLGSIQIGELNLEMNEFLIASGLKNQFEPRITGTADLIDKNNQYLAAKLMLGLLIAFGVIGLVVALMFKSTYMLFISLIVNVLPLLLVGAFMWVKGIDLRISTSLIFTIAFGIAVDDTIHFLSRYRHELKSGRDHLYAIKRTFISTGKAIIMTTIMLSAGFLTLILSTFASTYYIGLLVSLTLVFAVATDLLLLPVLLLIWKGHKQWKS